MAILKECKEGGYSSIFDCVITDIEMPVMDGKYLTKLIREDEILGRIPVLIFSSLVDNGDFNENVIGADAELGKPDIVRLVTTINNMFENA